MSASQTELRDLEAVFVYDLQAAYDMELKLVDALDELSRTATNDNLSAGFAVHRTETETQVRCVEEAFRALGEEPTRREDLVTDGLLEEIERFDARVADDELRNLHYLDAAIKTERVEISHYEGLLRTAEEAGLSNDVMAPLEGVLEQEAKTLRKLQGLAGESDLQRLWNALTDL